AIERLHEGDAAGLLLVVDGLAPTAQPRLVPSGARPLVDCVRTSVPGMQHALGRMLSGMVVVDSGWRAAMEVSLAHPDLVVLTPSGDRFGGGLPWRIGGAASTVTHAAFEEAVGRAAEAEANRSDRAAGVGQARAALDTARAAAADLLALEHRRTMVHERLVAVEARLAARDRDEHAQAERQRARLLGRGH